MKPQTLSHIKTQLQEFNNLVKLTTSYWDSPKHYITISVLVQNLAFDGKNCKGYDHDTEVAKMFAILNILHEFATYYKSHVEQWVYEEVSAIIDGNTMFEETEDKQEPNELSSPFNL